MVGVGLVVGAVLAVAHATDRNGKKIGAVRSSLGKCMLAVSGIR